MAETDRQKLERLVKEHQERRLAAERKKLEEIEAERKQRESLDLEDREKTKTLFAWCKETFEGFKLGDTYDITVSCGDAPSRYHVNTTDDGLPFIHINILPWQSGLAVFMARHRRSTYRLYKMPSTHLQFTILPEFKDAMLKAVAAIDSDELENIIGTARQNATPPR
jgi:hypothetical protein